MLKPLFVTLFMARSGSKFLRSLLNQHPDIQDFGEFFHDRHRKFPQEGDLFAGLGQILLTQQPVRGIQFRYPRHFTETPEFPALLEACPKAVKVLLLKRRNKLKGAISQQNSERLKRDTGKAHLFRDSGDVRLGKLELDIPRALDEASQRDRLDSEYKTWAENRFDTLEVFYEDLVADRTTVVNDICHFLGLRPFKPESLRESTLVKVTSDTLSDAIANHDALVPAARARGMERWLDDGGVLSLRRGADRAVVADRRTDRVTGLVRA